MEGKKKQKGEEGKKSADPASEHSEQDWGNFGTVFHPSQSQKQKQSSKRNTFKKQSDKVTFAFWFSKLPSFLSRILASFSKNPSFSLLAYCIYPPY